jgi:Holliday junction resolvase
MPGKSSRTKGATAEREIVGILSEAGYDVHRCPHSGALSWMKGDIVGTEYVIECKRQEQTRLNDWVTQAREQAGNKPWLLMHRRSRQEWLVTMPLAQWLRERER